MHDSSVEFTILVYKNTNKCPGGKYREPYKCNITLYTHTYLAISVISRLVTRLRAHVESSMAMCVILSSHITIFYVQPPIRFKYIISAWKSHHFVRSIVYHVRCSILVLLWWIACLIEQVGWVKLLSTIYEMILNVLTLNVHIIQQWALSVWRLKRDVWLE